MDKKYILADNVKIIIENKSILLLSTNDKLELNLFIFEIIKAFLEPMTISEVLSKSQNKNEWVYLASIIQNLVEKKFLKEESGVLKKSSLKRRPNFNHFAMLNDYSRTSSYQKAIFQNITKDDIVLDIGTGTGILALTAAKAGAKHVYAIESDLGIFSYTKKILKKNGFEDRITLINKHSMSTILPEKATVLIHELIGSDPLDEGVISIVTDAKKRLLTPNAKILPNKLNIFAIPFTIPDDDLPSVLFAPNFKKWNNWYDIDFSPLLKIDNNTRLVKPLKAEKWQFISSPISISNIDFYTEPDFLENINLKFTATTDGHLNGFLIFFEINFNGKYIISNNPKQINKDNHWENLVCSCSQPKIIKTGEEINFKYSSINNRSSITVI